MEKLCKRQDGITLIALVIMIIVLLILAGVAIATITGENGIPTKASTAKTLTEKANLEEQIKIAVMASMIGENGIGGIDGTILEEELAKVGITADMIEKQGEDGALPWIISVDGYKFQIQEDGTVESINGISLSSTNLKMVAGQEPVKLTATLTEGLTGTVVWSSSDESVAKVNNGEVSAVGTSGTAVITAKVSGTDYSATCTVTVVAPKGLQVGDYVEYNVTYTDMFSDTDPDTEGLQGYEFTKVDGWRVLDPGNYDETTKTATGVKLISTGVPARLYYAYSTVKNFEKDAAETYGKWAGDSSQREAYANEFYASSSNDNYNMYAAAGLYKNFGKIKFSQGTTSNANEGYYTKVNGKKEGNLAEGEFIVAGKAIEVHNLTLAELNKAEGRTDLTSTGYVSSDLFYLRGLNKYGYSSSSSPYYWLASPYTGDTYDVRCVYDDGWILQDPLVAYGVRPVVSLSSEVYKDGDVWRIR